jgi:hypothetical protein
MCTSSALCRALIAAATALAAITLAAGPAAASCDSGQRWSNGGPHYVWGTTSIPVGLRGAVRNGVLGWNGVSNSTWALSWVEPGPFGPPYNGGWASWGGGSGFFGAPAITTQQRNASGIIVGANSYFDPSWSWNASGVMDQASRKADVTTVVMHEMGHWLRLKHPSQCHPPSNAEIAAVMQPIWTAKWSLAPDDRAASAAKY